MGFRSSRKHSFEIFSNSFSDIMFFLMLFFLIASTMITPGTIKLMLPQANQTQSMNKPPKEIAVSITKDLKYYINNKQVQFLEIEPALRKEKKEYSDVHAIVRCDNSVAVQSLIDVLQIGSKIEMKMVLATTRKEKTN